ncbi:MAG TPA: DUF4382 domain-containing protein [Myxococcaceae bacterium]|nr:DUF4382 domain-containing protein [Myxococcaceae bacterium]
MPASRLPLPLLLFALALSGCGSNAFTLYLNSSESESPILTTTALDGPRDTLIHAKQVRLTFSSASVYLAGILARTPDPESELGWVELLSEPLSIDLINLRGDQLRKLGEGTLPAANTLSQIRLRLQAPEPAVDGWHLLPGAVVDAGDARCDLRIPAEAVEPGLTLPEELSFSAGEGDAELALVISIRLDGATLVQDDAEGCTWELEPVLYLRPMLEPTTET